MIWTKVKPGMIFHGKPINSLNTYLNRLQKSFLIFDVVQINCPTLLETLSAMSSMTNLNPRRQQKLEETSSIRRIFDWLPSTLQYVHCLRNKFHYILSYQQGCMNNWLRSAYVYSIYCYCTDGIEL